MILYTEKDRSEVDPHKWFAWYPVWAGDKRNDIGAKYSLVWLEYVERWRYENGSCWHYTLIKEKLRHSRAFLKTPDSRYCIIKKNEN